VSISTYAPNDTIPYREAAREYALPSCSACLRIACRKGWSIGDLVPSGEIKAFSHTADGVVALVADDHGFICMEPIR
jgi:hypothetical protein